MSRRTRSGGSTPHNLDLPKPNGTKRKSPIASQLELDMPNTGWQEPPLKTPEPTFQEQGVARSSQSALANIQAIGARPTARQLANATRKEPPRKWTPRNQRVSGRRVPKIRIVSDSLATAATTPIEGSSRPHSSGTEQGYGNSSAMLNGRGGMLLLPSSVEPISAASSHPPEITTAVKSSETVEDMDTDHDMPIISHLDEIPNATGDFKAPYDQALLEGKEDLAAIVKYLHHKATNNPQVDRVLTAMANTAGNPQDRSQSLLNDYENTLQKYKKRAKRHLHQQHSALLQAQSRGIKPLTSVEDHLMLDIDSANDADDEPMPDALLDDVTMADAQIDDAPLRRRTRALTHARAARWSPYNKTPAKRAVDQSDQSAMPAPRRLKLSLTHKPTPTLSLPDSKGASASTSQAPDSRPETKEPKKLRLISTKPSVQPSSIEPTPQASSQVAITGSSADQSPADSSLPVTEQNIAQGHRKDSSPLSSADEQVLPPTPAKKRISPRENKGKKRARDESSAGPATKGVSHLDDEEIEDYRRLYESKRIKESVVSVVESNARGSRDDPLKHLPPKTPNAAGAIVSTPALKLTLSNTGHRATATGEQAIASLEDNPADQGSRRSARVRAAAKPDPTPVKPASGKATQPTKDEERPVSRLSDSTDDSDELCYVCNDVGDLVCCDTCPRSFHYNCARPALTKRQAARLPVWVCQICTSEGKTIQQAYEMRAAAANEAHDEGSKSQSQTPALMQPTKKTRQRARFALEDEHVEDEQAEDEDKQKLEELESPNLQSDQSQYELESPVRDNFEGNGVAEDLKSYSEMPKEIPNVNGKAPDGYRLVDKDEKPIYCFACKKGSDGTRYIMACDYCSEKWHLDCLDPPLTNPPRKCVQSGKTRLAWMCPLHAEHTQRMVNQINHKARPKHRRYRKARSRSVVPVNRGNIEVTDDSSDDDDRFEQVNGEVLQVSAKGIKLDFIAQVRERNRLETQTREKRTRDALLLKAEHEERTAKAVAVKAEADARASMLVHQNLKKRSLVEQQTALNLVQFKAQDETLDQGAPSIGSLINHLIAEAPAGVFDNEVADAAAVAGAAPSSVTDEEREQLLNLQELIKRRLA